MSKYDQRMLKITSNILYFQLIPKTLTNLSPCQYTIDKLTFTLFKGQHIIDRTKRPVSLINNGYVGTISHAFINFDISCNEHQYNNQQYTIIVHGSMINQIKVDHEQSQQVAEVFVQVGQFRIPVGDYIAQFLESGKTLFCQRFKLNNQLTLDMQIHTQRIRFMLQKNVRQSNHYQHANSPQKYQKQSEIKLQSTQFDKKSTNNQNLIIILPRTKSQQIYHKDNSATEENQKNQSYCYQIAQENIQEMIHDQLNVEDKRQQGGQRGGEEGKQKQQEQSQVPEQWQKQTKLQKECSQQNLQLLESENTQQVQEKYEQNGQIQLKQEVKIQGSEPELVHIFQQKQKQQHGQNQLSEQLLQEQQHLWGQGHEQQSENTIISKQQQRQHEQSQLEGGTVQLEQNKYTLEHENVHYRQQEHRQTIAAENSQLSEQIQLAQEHELLQQIQKEQNVLRQEYEQEQKQKHEKDQHESQQQYYKDQEQKEQEQEQEEEQEEEKMEQIEQKQGKLRIEAKQKEKDELSLKEDKQRKRVKQQQRLESDSGCLLEDGGVSSEKMGKQEEINKRGEQIKRKDETSGIRKKEANILKKQMKKEEPVLMRAQRVGREQTDIRNNNKNASASANANANVRARVQRNQQASNTICRRILICLIICSIVLLFYSSSSNSKTDFV